MRKYLLVGLSLLFLVACENASERENVDVIDANALFGADLLGTELQAGGPTGCSTLRNCTPCTNGCILGAANACVATGCAFNVKCTDNPANCTASCSVKCVP